MSRMSDTEKRRAATLASLPKEYRQTAGRVFDAERRVERGIGVRVFYVGFRDFAIAVQISDELAVLAREGLAQGVAYLGGDMTESRFCRSGLHYLAEHVSAPDTVNQNTWGAARLTLYRIYDDMVLRRFRPWDGEQIFRPIGDFANQEPPNEYWLILNDDGPETFQLLFAKPEAFPEINPEFGAGKTFGSLIRH